MQQSDELPRAHKLFLKFCGFLLGGAAWAFILVNFGDKCSGDFMRYRYSCAMNVQPLGRGIEAGHGSPNMKVFLETDITEVHIQTHYDEKTTNVYYHLDASGKATTGRFFRTTLSSDEARGLLTVMRAAPDPYFANVAALIEPKIGGH